MSKLNEEYKKYFIDVLEYTYHDLCHQDEHNLVICPKLKFKIEYLKLRIDNIKYYEPGFEHGYEPTNEWSNIPEVCDKLLGYNNWLNDRRKRGIDSIFES